MSIQVGKRRKSTSSGKRISVSNRQAALCYRAGNYSPGSAGGPAVDLRSTNKRRGSAPPSARAAAPPSVPADCGRRPGDTPSPHERDAATDAGGATCTRPSPCSKFKNQLESVADKSTNCQDYFLNRNKVLYSNVECAAVGHKRDRAQFPVETAPWLWRAKDGGR